MRKNWTKKFITDPRKKKLTTGFMGLSKEGKPQMKKTGHFVSSNPDTGEVYFPELRELYGDNAQEIFIAFPSDNYSDFFSDNFNLWTSTHSLRRRCDGDVCEHIIDEVITVEGKTHKYKAGEESECICEKLKLKEQTDKALKNLACSCDMYLKCWIINPKTGTILTIRDYQPFLYILYTGSVHTADNLRSQFDVMKRFIGIPFRLTTEYHKKEKKSYTLWEIVPYPTQDQISEYVSNTPLITEGQEMVFLNEASNPTKQLTAGIETEFENISEIPEEEISQEVPETLFTEPVKQEKPQTEVYKTFLTNIKKTFSIENLDTLISSIRTNKILTDNEKAMLYTEAEKYRVFIISSFKNK